MDDSTATKSAKVKSFGGSLSQFLQKHFIKKGISGDKPTITNTRIGNVDLKISGGSYYIPEEEYDTFLELYYREVFVNKSSEFFTEKQLEQNGPILIDLDLKYNSNITRRIHTKEHVFDLVCVYLEELKKMYNFDENVNVPIYVFEKDTINKVTTQGKEITKDGIHILIGIQSDKYVSQILRERVICVVKNTWDNIPIINDWSDVFDEGVSKQHSNWQLYGSQKPNHEPYKLKYVYNVSIDSTDQEFAIVEDTNIQKYNSVDGLKKLSARNTKNVSLFMKNEFIDEYTKRKGIPQQKQNTVLSGNMNCSGLGLSSGYSLGVSIDEILSVRDLDQLKILETRFLDSLTISQNELKESFQYTMSLPASYYADGSYTKWLRVGWALRNISNELFIVWVIFSAQNRSFVYSTIRDDLWNRWNTFNMNDPSGLTKRSIMHWSKHDSPKLYKDIRDSSIDCYIDETLDSPLQNGKGSSDFDIANVLYQMYKDEYICVSVKSGIWYRYRSNRWMEIDSGTALRFEISTSLRKLYDKKMKQFQQKMLVSGTDVEDEKNPYKIKVNKCLLIIDRLGKCSEKKNIMTECKELFYDGTFLEKLDNNPYLMCFNNGVVDFKQKVFRNGVPEDCLSKCTNIDYVALNPVSHADIITEIEDFMKKLFPHPELCRYMWSHLSSTLIGTSADQTFNMYIGIGQNGKSVLVNLMEKCLGNYKGDVPLSLITQQRTKIGGLSPELVQLKGVRYAVMQEPSKGDKINEGIMKQITGGDPIQARSPYMLQTISYIPQFKLVVCSNEFMEIKSMDHGTWRRIRVVDFESLFTEKPVSDDADKPYQYKLDKNIKEKFDVWKPIFMSMMVDIAFKTNGMVEDCDKVMSSSNSYRERQDYYAEFINERIEINPTGCVIKAVLINVFKEWYNANYGFKNNNPKDITLHIDKRFSKNKNGVWVGISIKEAANPQNSTSNNTVNSEDGIADFDTNFAELEEL